MRQQLRLTKYFLRKWYYLDNNISNLDEGEETNAKVLYGALKHLTADERKLLADKYRVSIKPFRTDKEVAKEYEMDIAAYVHKRQMIEEKLSSFIKESINEYKGDSTAPITEIHEQLQRKQKKEKAAFMAMIEKRAKERCELN